MSLPHLPVEVLLMIEWYAKYDFRYRDLVPALQLSWVCQQLRAVFMPRFWSHLQIDYMDTLSRLVTLIESSPRDTYRDLVKYLCFNIGSNSRIDLRLYLSEPTPSANDVLDIEPSRQVERSCGPRDHETWPTPTELIFNDPKRYFQLAGRKDDPDKAYESDETGSSAASEAEVEETSCTICHPLMRKVYRHRVKSDDYWLPGAVHSLGPLVFNRRTWGRYPGPDIRREVEGTCSLDTLEDFVEATAFLMFQLNVEAFAWAGSIPIPALFCKKLVDHPTFYKLDVCSNRAGRDALLLLAPRITVFQETDGTSIGDQEILFERDENDCDVYLPLSDYSEDNSMRGFMEVLLAAKKLKHLRSNCLGVFITPCLLGVYAKLHSLHWYVRLSTPDEHVMALSKLRSSLWQLAQAIGRPGHLLEPGDVQLLSKANGKYAERAVNLIPLAEWLADAELATLVAQGWNEQEERGPNDAPIFYPPCLADFEQAIRPSTLTSVYEDPESYCRL